VNHLSRGQPHRAVDRAFTPQGISRCCRRRNYRNGRWGNSPFSDTPGYTVLAAGAHHRHRHTASSG
jgi:hypothetical protein